MFGNSCTLLIWILLHPLPDHSDVGGVREGTGTEDRGCNPVVIKLAAQLVNVRDQNWEWNVLTELLLKC